MRSISARFDARLWGFLLVGALSVGSLVCIATAAMVQASTVGGSGGILSVTEALREIDARHAAAQRREKVRQGIMIERLPPADLSVAVAPVDPISP
jgi:hypothetical protein